MFITFVAAFMHSDVLIICFRGRQLGNLSSEVIRVISMVLEGQSKRQKEDKCNAYLSKGMWSAQKHETHGSSGLRKTIWTNSFLKGPGRKEGSQNEALFLMKQKHIKPSSVAQWEQPNKLKTVLKTTVLSLELSGHPMSLMKRQ